MALSTAAVGAPYGPIYSRPCSRRSKGSCGTARTMRPSRPSVSSAAPERVDDRLLRCIDHGGEVRIGCDDHDAAAGGALAPGGGGSSRRPAGTPSIRSCRRAPKFASTSTPTCARPTARLEVPMPPFQPKQIIPVPASTAPSATSAPASRTARPASPASTWTVRASFSQPSSHSPTTGITKADRAPCNVRDRVSRPGVELPDPKPQLAQAGRGHGTPLRSGRKNSRISSASSSGSSRAAKWPPRGISVHLVMWKACSASSRAVAGCPGGGCRRRRRSRTARRRAPRLRAGSRSARSRSSRASRDRCSRSASGPSGWRGSGRE
jgi:hypothetical protein